MAADQGDAQAQYNLGVMIANGQGTIASAEVAMQWFQLAADQGDAQAQFDLGALQQAATPPQFTQALDNYRRAAAQGHADGQAALGWLYANGAGVLQDYVRAHMWFNLGAVSGHAAAAYGRDFVAQQMTPAQIAEAQDMARACQRSNFKDFD